jgi:hypothetical protein
MKTITLLAILIAACALSSCTKSDTPEKILQNCRLLQNVRLEGGSPVDSFNYQYNEGGQLVKVAGNNYDYTLEYDATKVVRRKYFYSGTQNMFATDTVIYYAGGTINEIRRVDQNGLPVQTTTFTYNNNKLTALSFYNKDNELKARYNYTYTINNITAITGDESWNNINRSFSYKLMYDTRSNNLKQGQQALLHDGFLSDHMGLSVIYVLSDNYVKTLEQNGLTVPVSYTLDDNNNVTAILVGGEPVMRGSYQCR